MIKRLYILVVFFCCLLVWQPGTCWAQEYSMTEQELTRLEQIFGELQINNKQLLSDLEISKTDLLTARSMLEKYQADLELLQEQLITSKQESTIAKTELQTAQASLQKVNKSLEKLEQEAKAEVTRLKWQRNMLMLVVGILLT